MTKSFFTKARWLVTIILLLLLSTGQVWGGITNNNNGTYTETSGTGTYSSPSITWSFAGGNITVVQNPTGGGAVGSSYTTAARIYRYHTLTVSASNGFKIEKVEIVCDGTYYGNSIAAGTSQTNNVVGNTSDVTSSVTYSSGNTHSFTPATAGAKTLFYIRNVNSGSTNTQLRWTSGNLKVTYSYDAPSAVAAGTITSSSFGLSITDALNTNKYDVYFSTSSTAPTATTSATVANQTTKTPTISSGVSAGQNYYVWVRSVKTVSSDTWKSLWTAMTSNPLSTPSAGCANYSFHFGTRSSSDWNDPADYCFEASTDGDGNSGVYYYLSDFTLPAKPHYYVGWQGSWNTSSAKSADADFSGLCFGLLRANSCATNTLGTYSAGNNQGAVGTLRIRSSYTDNNKYIDFIPGGYVLSLSENNGSTYSTTALTAASSALTETVWTTGIVTVSSNLASSGKFFVDLATSSGHVWSPNISQVTATSSMGYKTNSGDNWGTGLSSGMRGKFRIWADNCNKNWNCHFVPYHRIIYHANYPVGDSPADTYSTDVSVEETKSDIALPSAPTAPTGYTFAGWYDAASGGTKKTGNQTISAGASADPEYYAHWYGITLVVKDEDGTTLSGDGKPTLTRSGLSLTATTAGNYAFKDIQITSGTGTLSSTSSTTPTITAISSDITVTATFYKPIAITKGTNTGAATFTLSATEVARGGNVTITCAADGTHKGNPTITATSGNYTSISVASATSASVNGITGPVTINISYTAKETATVKLHVAGSTSTISGTRYEGDSYTLPSEAAECPDMGLYGWYTTDYEHATTAPSGANFKLPGASATLAAGDNDFYAVYATITPDAANTYTKITSTGELVTGDYLIVGTPYSTMYAMKNAYYSSESTMADESRTVTDNKITNSASDKPEFIWHFTKSNSTITIYSANSSKYFGFSSNHVALMNSSQNLTYEVSDGKWAIYSGSDYLTYASYFQRGASKVYQTYLFKRDPSVAGPYTTSPSCTTHTLTVNMDPVAPDGCSAAAVKTVLGETKTTTATATAGDHYVFSYWTISGTGSTMSNTVDNKSTDNPVTVTMGTADATLTAHFTEKEKCTVVFKNNGGTESSTTYWLGENPVAPTLTDGTSGDACDATSDKHFGWTQTAWSNTLEQAAIDAKTDADVKVYAKDATLPAITAGDDGTTITYHAVWSKVTGGTTTISIDGDGLQAVVEDQTSGYEDIDFSVGGYTFHVSAATKCTDSGTAQYWFQLKKNNDAITIPTLPGKITNISSTAIRTATSGSVSTGVYFNSSATTSAAIASETLSGATSFSLDVTGNNSSGYLLFGAATCINQLSVTYSTASYSKYLTTCCENIVEAPTVTGTPTKNSITLSWTNVTGATGYIVTSSGGTPGDVTSDGTARSCVITGLSPNTNYTWSVVATYTTPYCLANTANGNTTTSQVYAVSYNKNGGTIANLPSGGTYAAGEEVTVAAKPDGTVNKSGYTFTGWNTANDGSGEHYDADGSTSFTMPSEAVTLYAEWTAKKNYFVDRMHGNWDGEHTEPTTGYNCYLREGAGYTVPDLSDDATGSNSCVSGHEHFIGWVIASKIGAQGQLLSGYTVIKGGTVQTAGTDGTIYYAVWAEE